uniref:Ribosomal protein L31 n=1 Tax=Sargassum horneri TaxID=74089 RepID=A0A068LIV7_9PHAE|nr:ribosomal protein L31 [Sargassum horneri]AIE46215.1 ribosomal protein L31 [Sargassum horneri]AWW89676.1 ribosomal protein L31 [Sargassum horneri]AWW89713.1 ribosomal protein L31 [Sargassum horneri]AWW89750.1 ribosomal protein L31 [Sargassum horneri]AWW89787.1 ribosomal protein L31 [Sargassum horneri]
MRIKVKQKLLGHILSDGSFHFVYNADILPELFKTITNLDISNHSVWTGRGPKEQTEVTSFIVRFNKDGSV